MKLHIVFALTLAFIVLKTSADDVGNVLCASQFEQMLKHRNDGACEGKGFYTYNAFLTAARSFDGFGTTGDLNTRKRELAAFLAQTSHETTGGGKDSWDGPYAWGYCLITEKNKINSYCDPGTLCTPGKSYYGRGPIQLTHNYNYDKVGKALNADLINNPDLVARDAVISFKTAIWFWMTPEGNKPSSHDVITNKWIPCAADRAANRRPGYGVISNIFNGGIECGQGPNDASDDRIGFYKRFCNILGLTYGPNLDCKVQQPYDV